LLVLVWFTDNHTAYRPVFLQHQPLNCHACFEAWSKTEKLKMHWVKLAAFLLQGKLFGYQ